MQYIVIVVSVVVFAVVVVVVAKMAVTVSMHLASLALEVVAHFLVVVTLCGQWLARVAPPTAIPFVFVQCMTSALMQLLRGHWLAEQ